MVFFDLRETLIPFSLMKIANAFRSMRPGEEMELVAGVNPVDVAVFNDLMRILPRAGYDIVCKDDLTGEEVITRLRLRKKTFRENPATQRRIDMSAIDLNSVTAANTVDARGSACPGPLLEAKKGIGKVKVGEILEIYSNDAGTRTDVPAWAKKVGHDYLGMVEADGYDKHFVCRKK